ncbi:hypothetical protein BDV96DRAFT_585430 [Lophiotrema nucula]|uniref:Heterokaryon incompatibility domain-containing protein n=1 Tax=Lophiotrema nucula TaxID=690887 RepID=A0A6A5YQW3_9PLEO|nr:hypothetical protein BDV96DRAFT_585430 [Lophiotrema nucula]
MLLFLLEQDPDAHAGSIKVEGSYWRLSAEDLDAYNAKRIPFTCVSYTWGKGREPSPFFANHEVSDRTISALTATIRCCPLSTRIWVDAFCVPLELPERAHTLESMGHIYSCAEQVIVVLSNASVPVLNQMKSSDRIDPSLLDVLEKEDWITRAWTYQEAVNSKKLFFTCENARHVMIDGSHFLNCLGFTLSRLDKTVDKRRRYPRLDAFEDLIADYMIAGYEERSALQVMSNMDRRTESTKERPEDHFYAMVGAIIADHASSSGITDPCEAFMILCERKGDYSFIYSAATRDSASLRRWRPVSGDLPSILPLHCWGGGQPGHEDSGSFYLDEMLVLERSALGKEGEKFVESWLASSETHAGKPRTALDQAAYIALRTIGFYGSSDCIPTTEGLFFPLTPVLPELVSLVLIATQVRWTLGAPGLVRYHDGDMDFFLPGVFFGRVDNAATCSVKVSS